VQYSVQSLCFNVARVDLRQTIIIVNDYARDDAEFASQISTAVNRDSPELETVETDVDLQTPRSADALLCRQTSPQLTRLTCSDHDEDLSADPWSGTSCRTTSAHSRTMSPLDRAWKPGFSPDTSVFSTLETFVIIALYKSTFTIPYHTTQHRRSTVSTDVTSADSPHLVRPRGRTGLRRYCRRPWRRRRRRRRM